MTFYRVNPATGIARRQSPEETILRAINDEPANTPPEATSAPLTALGRSAHSWVPKGLREHLCQQQTFSPDERTRWTIQILIDLLDAHRPVGPDGKHGDRHTDTCGCEDR